MAFEAILRCCSRVYTKLNLFFLILCSKHMGALEFLSLRINLPLKFLILYIVTIIWYLSCPSDAIYFIMSLRPDRYHCLLQVIKYLHSLADLLGCLPCDFRIADKQVAGTIEHLQAVISTFHTW
jgi:hypothetical protein